MNAYPLLSGLYGQLRGYRRMTIRRAVRAAARLTPEELTRQADARFQRRVREAVRLFPSYAQRVQAVRGRLPTPGERVRPEELPVWTRADQRELFARIEGPPVPGSFAHATGGSTGVPVRFYVTRESFEWRSAVADRGYSWAGAEEGRRSFYVWGTPIRPPGAPQRAKAALHHWLQRRTYYDSFDFGEAQKRACCRIINRLRPPVVVGYAGNLIELARFVRDQPGALAWKPRRLITAAEGLLPGQRELIEAHLGGRVWMSYGSREFMLIGMECAEQRGYHLAADNLLVEVVDDGGAAARPGATGRILITDLHNAANPFIRYEIGDLGALAPPGHRCPCGRPFPVLSRVEGRVQEVIVLPGGDRLTALFIPHLMKEFPEVQGYQIVQPTARRLEVNLIAGGPLAPELTGRIEAQLRRRVGAEMEIVLARVAQLRRNRTGKTPIVISAAQEGR